MPPRPGARARQEVEKPVAAVHQQEPAEVSCAQRAASLLACSCACACVVPCVTPTSALACIAGFHVRRRRERPDQPPAPCAHALCRYNITRKHMEQLVESIQTLGYQYVLIDCPAGIDIGFVNAISPAKEAIIVTTPEITSIRQAGRNADVPCRRTPPAPPGRPRPAPSALQQPAPAVPPAGPAARPPGASHPALSAAAGRPPPRAAAGVVLQGR